MYEDDPLSDIEIIGYGDDIVEEWCGPVGESINILSDNLFRGDNAGYYVVDWAEIFSNIPELKNTLSQPQYCENIEEVLGLIPNIIEDRLSWGGDAPGRSGTYIICRVAEIEQPRTQKLIEIIIELVNKYLNESVEYKQIMTDFKKKQEELRANEVKRLLEEERLETLRSEKLVEEEKLIFKRKVDEAVSSIDQYLNYPNKPFYSQGMLLITSDCYIYWMKQIWNYRSLEDPRFYSAVINGLGSRYKGIIEVKEVVKAGVEMPHIPGYGIHARPRYVGWMHRLTTLEVIGECNHKDPNEVRDEFLKKLMA